MQVASSYIPSLNNRFTVWIDYNNDEVFTSNEVVLNAGETGLKYVQEMITIPVDSNYIGIRRLRVMMAGSIGTLDSCGEYYSGEVEDYFINITDSYIVPCYCTPFVINGSGSRIEDFKIGDIFNCNSGYNHPTYHSFYPDSIFTTDLEIGKTYRALVSTGSNIGTSVGIRIDIDSDDNHIFESDENIYISPIPNTGIVDKYITIPNDSSLLGQHRMRVRISQWGPPSSSCFWGRGETEDYIINIIPQDSNQVIIPDWQKVIHLPKDQRVTDIIETYDNGFAVSVREESDTAMLRVVKFNIDGDTLWTKYPNTLDDYNYPSKMHESHDGGFIICGVTDADDSFGDPYALKLNACGDLQWKATYGNFGNYDTASHIIQAADSNYIVLLKYLSDTSRIALVKLDTLGNVIWQYDYNHHWGSEPKALMETSDRGFLITGHTYTPNPGDSTLVWLRSMLIKIDSNGNEQWEKVLGIGDTTVSNAYCSVELETGGFLVSTSIVDIETDERNLGVYRVDETGDLLFYKTISDIDGLTYYGDFIRKMQGENYCLVSRITNDCFDYSPSMLGLYMIDANANSLDSAFVKDHYLDVRGAIVTDNNKLVVSGTKEFPDHDEIFMFKFNEDLEFDTLYNLALDYDWLFCDITLSAPELLETNIDIDVFPNPAHEGVNIRINESSELIYKVKIISIDGSILKRGNIYSNELKYFSLESFNQGVYIISISHENHILSSRKIIKSR